MPPEQSLSDLRAIVEAEEAAQAGNQPQPEPEIEEELLEGEGPEGDTEANPEAEGGEPLEELEDWQKPDDEETQKNDLVPLAKHLDVKNRLKEKAATELSQRDARIAELEKQLQQGQAQALPQVDDLEIAVEIWEFQGDPSQYPRYIAEVNARNALKLQAAEARKAQAQQEQAQAAEYVSAEIDKHYERAAELIGTGKITEDRFKTAEATVLNRLDANFPGMGKAVIDTFIADLGKGSEKVIFHLGTNAAAMQAFEDALKSDKRKSGLKAFGVLVSLRDRFESKPVVRPTPAPKPDTPLVGKASSFGAEQKAYEKAHASGDAEKAFDIKMAARAKGINTSKW
jgi:hypothetical protein